MSFAQANGYTPVAIEVLMDAVRVKVNEQFATSFTAETFVGSNWYKLAYAALQRAQGNEVKTSEIFQKLQQYIATTNERIRRPSVSTPGLIEQFADAGFVASVKPPADADAGKLFVCVDLDNAALDFATKKLAVNTLIKDYAAAGLVPQGAQTTLLTLSNGQQFTFKFALPNRIPVLLRLTAVKSENSLVAVPTDEAIRTAIFANTAALYSLGKNFEPQRYYTLEEAPWAQSVLLEWSSDAGVTWHSTVYDAAFDALFDFDLGDISVVLS